MGIEKCAVYKKSYVLSFDSEFSVCLLLALGCCLLKARNVDFRELTKVCTLEEEIFTSQFWNSESLLEVSHLLVI